jgi:hypothetical protein
MGVKKIVPSDNILKIRALTEQICKEENTDLEYKKVVRQLKNIVDEGVKEIEISETPKTKMKCYENMCKTIKTLLNSIKLI